MQLFSKCPNVTAAEFDLNIKVIYLFIFAQVILDAWEKGVNPSGNSTNPSNWDFSSSFFFAGTVVTTIGEPCKFIILTVRFVLPPSLNDKSSSGPQAMAICPLALCLVRCSVCFMHCVGSL